MNDPADPPFPDADAAGDKPVSLASMLKRRQEAQPQQKKSAEPGVLDSDRAEKSSESGSSPAGAADLAPPVRRRSASSGGSEPREAGSVGAHIFCVANQKGGVGKTTTTVNLAAGLAKVGQRVLMVDLDPQGNATMGSGVDKRKLELTVYDVLLESASILEARVTSQKLIDAGCGYDILGANRELAGAEVELVEVERRERRLKAALAEVSANYDFVLIDCPPSLSMLTLNGLCSAHGVVVPMQCEYFALEGLTDLVNTIKQVHANLNKDLEIIGLLRVMFDPRITLQQQVSDQLKSHFGDKVFDTVIPRNVRLAEAPSYGVPGVVFDPSSKGAQAFLTFAGEMVERIKTMGAATAGARK